MTDSTLPFDPEVITARLLADTLRRMMAEEHRSATWLGSSLGIGDDAVLAWLKGEHLKHPVRFLAAIDLLGHDVVFRRRGGPRKIVRLR
jgi:hypothetical protein